MSPYPPPDKDWLYAGSANLVLEKQGSQVACGIPAEFHPEAILIVGTEFPIAQGDRLVRTLPNQLRVACIVDDPAFRPALGGIPARFEVVAHRAAPIDSLKPAEFWRERRSEFEALSTKQREILGVNKEHKDWLRGACSRLYQRELAFCDVDGGLDREFRAKFEDTATQASVALGGADADVVRFWVACLCLDLLQNPPAHLYEELLQSLDEGGFIRDLLASSAAYCSRLAAMAERRADGKTFQNRHPTQTGALLGGRARPQFVRAPTPDEAARPNRRWPYPMQIYHAGGSYRVVHSPEEHAEANSKGWTDMPEEGMHYIPWTAEPPSATPSTWQTDLRSVTQSSPEEEPPLPSKLVGKTSMEVRIERRRLRDAYKQECKAEGVKVTDAMIAEAASKKWHGRTAVQKWIACHPSYDGMPDSLIRQVFNRKPHLQKK